MGCDECRKWQMWANKLQRIVSDETIDDEQKLKNILEYCRGEI